LLVQQVAANYNKQTNLPCPLNQKVHFHMTGEDNSWHDVHDSQRSYQENNFHDMVHGESFDLNDYQNSDPNILINANY